MSCPVCTENDTCDASQTGTAPPFLCVVSGTYEVKVTERNISNTVLGICCFISAVFILIGCFIRWTDHVKHKHNNVLRSDVDQSKEVLSESLEGGPYSFSSSARYNGARLLQQQQRPVPGFPGSLELATRDLLGTDASEGLDISSKGSHISDLAFCVRASDIVLHDQLAAGNYGKVFSAYWQGNWVAVKVLKHKKADQLNEVLNEVALLIRLRHPNVVVFYGCTPPPEPYLISELLWGSLYKLLFEYVPLPRKDSRGINSTSSKGDKVHDEHLSDIVKFRIIKDIANGLAYIHGSGIIHRDVSSSNVLVTAPREELEALVRKDYMNLPPFAKVADFGLSRGVDADRDPAAVNLLYLSPEGYRGDSISTQSDVFSYSLVMWETYMALRPFNDEENEKISAYKVTCEGLRPPITSEFPEGIAMLVKDCWVDDPHNRPTMKAVMVALQEMEKLWRTHNLSCSTDDDGTMNGNEWDGVAVKPAVSTYSTFDDEDDRRYVMGKKNSYQRSFRIGDLTGIHDDNGDSADEKEGGGDIDDRPLGEGACATSAERRPSTRSDDDTVGSQSSCSLYRAATTRLKGVELREFQSAPGPNDSERGNVLVNDVYHEFFSLHGASNTTAAAAVHVPGGKGEERGGGDAAASASAGIEEHKDV